MSEQLDASGVGSSANGIEQTEHDSCPLECADCGAYPMQAVYDWEMREIICTKCGYYPEKDYFDPETVVRWEVEEEIKRSL